VCYSDGSFLTFLSSDFFFGLCHPCVQSFFFFFESATTPSASLSLAARQGDVATIKALVKAGADLDQQDQVSADGG
jgi:hypothetical protein